MIHEFNLSIFDAISTSIDHLPAEPDPDGSEACQIDESANPKLCSGHQPSETFGFSGRTRIRAPFSRDFFKVEGGMVRGLKTVSMAEQRLSVSGTK